MRRLPVYLVIDCSESMAGPGFEAVQAGIRAMFSELRGDPMALETVWISVIAFHGTAKVVKPLTDLCLLEPPHLVLGSGTSLGAALELLVQRMQQEVVVQTEHRKGDWKPVVFLLTDGNPTDTWFSIADHFKSHVSGKKANVIALVCGPDVEIGNLKRITSAVVSFKDSAKPSFADFFKWVSQSVQTTSARFLDGATEGVALPNLPVSMELAPEGLQMPGDSLAFLLTRCGVTKNLAIMRFERLSAELARSIGAEGIPLYRGVAGYPIAEFDLGSGDAGMGSQIQSSQLLDMPRCPHCGQEFWASCGQCGRMFCIEAEGTWKCSWCAVSKRYSVPERGFTLNRGLG